MESNNENTSIETKVFKSQIKELLQEVHSTKSLSIVSQLCDAIKSTPKPHSLKLYENGLSYIPTVPDHIKHFNFHAPTTIHLIGSSSLGTALKRPYVVEELAVEIPAQGLKEKLLKNHGFLYRRLLYLSNIAHHLLENCDFVCSIQWDSDSDWRRPDLLVTLKDSFGTVVKNHLFRVTTVISMETFGTTRFRPDRSNLPGHQSVSQHPTPIYNSILVREISRLVNHRFMKELLHNQKKICQGAVLLKVWLKQRGLLNNCCGGLGDEMVDLLVAHLLQRDVLNRLMSPYHILISILQYLAETADWIREGVETASLTTEERDASRPSLEQMKTAYPVVFIGQSGYDNLASTMQRGTFEWLKFESRSSLKYIHNESSSCFDALFMTSQNMFEKFDHVIVLKKTEMLRPIVERHNLLHNLIDTCEDVAAVTLPVVCDLLTRCLDKRLVKIHADLESIQNNRSKGSPILIGLVLNPSLTSLTIDRGPQSGTEESAAFRHLWGAKSEMRHIDGDLKECLVWSSKNVTIEIVEYVLQKLLGLTATFSECHQVNPNLSQFVSYHPQVLHRIEKTQAELTPTLTRIKDDLCTALRSLNSDLPLDITSVRAVNSTFRATSVFPPLPVSEDLITVVKNGRETSVKRKRSLFPVFCPVQHLIVSLEISGKWPDELDRFYDMKKLFLIRIHSLFTQRQITCRVHQDGYLDVYKSGYLFRLHVAQAKESSLLRQVRSAGHIVEVDSPQSRAWERLHIHLPHLAAILSGLVARWPNVFAATCRLAKRWLSGQCVQLWESGDALWQDELVESGMNEVVVELMVAACFLSPLPYTEPSCELAAFLRFLRLLGYHDWQSRPLIVNLNEELSETDMDDISNAFHRYRDQLPSIVINTSVDRRGDMWTLNGPSITGLKEIQALARQTHLVLKELLLGTNYEKSIKAVFRADVSDFDAVIELSAAGKSFHSHENLDVHKKEAEWFRNCFYYPVEDQWPRKMVDQDPVQLVIHCIRNSFGAACDIRHNPYGGQWIGIKWKPSSPEEKLESQLLREHVLQSIASQTGNLLKSIKIIQ